MRGGKSVRGGKFPTPKNKAGSRNGGEPLEFPGLGDLPIPPRLQPINDEWSISNFDDPVDARDCAAYPASPWCDGDFLDLKPIGYRVEIKSNECETCIYTYPILAFMVLQPLIVCHRKKNCRPEYEPPNLDRSPIRRNAPPRYNENVQPDGFKSPECAERESIIGADLNRQNSTAAEYLESEIRRLSEMGGRIRNIDMTEEVLRNQPVRVEYACQEDRTYPFRKDGAYVFARIGDAFKKTAIYITWEYFEDYQRPWGLGFTNAAFTAWTPAPCCGMPIKPSIKPPPPPPPPRDEDDDKKRKRKMCCNACNDSVDLSRAILKELKVVRRNMGEGEVTVPKEIDGRTEYQSTSVTEAVGYFGKLLAKRLGTGRYPMTVPLSLMSDRGDETQPISSITDYMYWLTLQVDALIGEFPINIEIKDIDPLTAGDQKKTLSIPNIAEALAEIYGLSAKTSVNQEVEQSMLLRLAMEAISIKNGVAITQDYARGNAKFLGYRGNPVDRELQYSFDFDQVDLKNKEQVITVDKLLNTSKGYVRGWENEDKETAVNFLQKILFSAGIIKAVFFRNKKQMKELSVKAESIIKDSTNNDNGWKEFLAAINKENSLYNEAATEKPEIDDKKGV